MKEVTPITLAIGDTVVLKETNETGIITTSDLEAGDVAYGFNFNCWYGRSDFDFVSRATIETLKEAEEMHTDKFGYKDY